MLGWALTFLILALVAGYMGFFGLAGLAATVAKLLLVVFLILHSQAVKKKIQLEHHFQYLHQMTLPLLLLFVAVLLLLNSVYSLFSHAAGQIIDLEHLLLHL